MVRCCVCEAHIDPALNHVCSICGRPVHQADMWNLDPMQHTVCAYLDMELAEGRSCHVLLPQPARWHAPSDGYYCRDCVLGDW